METQFQIEASEVVIPFIANEIKSHSKRPLYVVWGKDQI